MADPIKIANEAIKEPLSSAASSDRLSFTIFIAIAIHGLLIFGLGFEPSKPKENALSVTVTLATRSSTEKPKQADFMAQSNQSGSGTESEAKEITTDVIPPPFESERINDTLVNEQHKKAIIEPDNTSVVTTQLSDIITSSERLSNEEPQTANGIDALNIDALSTQIASLKAKLALQRQTLANKPRERVLTSVSTLASAEAGYLNEWTQKIEAIGNQNFPKKALQNKLTGQLRLEVVIKHDGTIYEINLKQSSGQKIFDESAQQIVRQASPFSPFPPDIRQDYEHLVIIRTWHFNISGLYTSQ
ncbi:MAG: protein TonB [Candidatus Endobugula sp.]|jgi:protein TonB